MEIGIDIDKIERFKLMSEHFKKRVFAKSEIENAKKRNYPEEYFCALWCVKEATVKAFSNLTLAFSKIEVAEEPNGKPYIVKNEMIKNELEKLGLSEIKISISHSKEYATAICLIY